MTMLETEVDFELVFKSFNLLEKHFPAIWFQENHTKFKKKRARIKQVSSLISWHIHAMVVKLSIKSKDDRRSSVIVFFFNIYFYFFVFLNWFNILISKINFKKYCFNIFINTKINFYYSSNTTMENLDFLIFWRAYGKWPSVWLNNCFDLDNPTTCLV
jgi:hypothetical protein